MPGEMIFDEYVRWKNLKVRLDHQLEVVEFLRSKGIPEFRDFPAEFEGYGWTVGPYGSVSWQEPHEENPNWIRSGSLTTGEFGSKVYIGTNEGQPCLKLHSTVLTLPDGFVWNPEE